MGLLKSAVASLLGPRGPAKAPTDASTSVAPSNGDRWRSLAGDGRLPEALQIIDEALGQARDDTALRIARSDVLRAWGRDQEAALEIRRTDPAEIAGSELTRRRAWVANRAGRLDEAVELLRRILAGDPMDVESTQNLGAALLALGRLDEAAECLRDAQERSPNELALLLALGSCELSRHRFVEAEALFRRATVLAPGSAAAHEHLGMALSALDRRDEGMAALVQAERIAAESGETVDAYANIGIGLCEIGKASDAIRVLVDGLRERPDVNGSLQIGPALLSQGHFRAGWRHFESRWLAEPLASVRANYGVPQWMGQSLEGRTVLVRSEQGLGDVFQFVRYLPLLKAKGAQVLFQPLQGMDRIALRFPGVDRVIAEGEVLPEFDFYANLMSLPLAFGTSVETIPREIPYLSADPARVAKWTGRLAVDDRPRVAMVWAGRPTHRHDHLRSLHFDQLAPILAVKGVRFVAMQKGPSAGQARSAARPDGWDDIGAELDDLDDAAAVLTEIDLLVCVDTGLAHLAGAMGKPVWVMVQTPSEYRWMTGGEGTPWYPTMRLFRQSAPREWGPVVARVAEALRRHVSGSGRKMRSSAQVNVMMTAPSLEARPSKEPDCAGLAVAAETRSGFLQFVPDEPRIGPSLERFGEWMQPRLDVVLRFVRPGAILIEVGAGVGAHALPLARAVGDDGVLLAYESRPAHRRLLSQNLTSHGITNSTVMLRTLGAAGFAPDRETVDDLRLARLDGLKVNEDADPAAILEGARETLWRCRPWLLVAATDPRRLDRTREDLREFGYRAWRMETPLDRPGNFNRRDEVLFGGEMAFALFALPEETDLRAPLPGCREWP